MPDMFKNMVNKYLKVYNIPYDDITAKTIEEIYKKDGDGNLINHSYEKWCEFIKDVNIPKTCTTEEAKRMEIIQTAIAKHPLLSNDGAHKLLSSTILYNSAINEILKRDGFFSDIYETALKKIPITELEKILDAEPTSKQPLCEYAMKKIFNQAFDDIIKTGNTNSKINTDIFKHSSQSNAIWKMICTNLNPINETILTNIVNNQIIDEKVRDKAFDLGCNWEKVSITTLTPHIAQTMYPSIVVYQFDDIKDMVEDGGYGSMTLELFSKRALTHSIEWNLLSYEQKTDLLNRIAFEKPDYMTDAGELFVTMLIYEQEKDLLEKMIEIIRDKMPDKQIYTDFLLKNEHFHKTKMFQETMYQTQQDIFSFGKFDTYKAERLEKIILNADLNSSTIYDTAKNCIISLNEPDSTAIFKHHEMKKVSRDLLVAIVKSPHTKLDDLKHIRQIELDSVKLGLLLDISIASRSQTKQSSINPTEILNALTSLPI